MKEFMGVAKALADSHRTRALMCLRGGELCVCRIIELLQLAPSTVSKHLDILRRAGLVESRKEGRWIYYRLAGKDAPEAAREALRWVRRFAGAPRSGRRSGTEDAPEAAREALRWVRRSLAKDPQITRDAARLKAIRKMDIKRLCEHYHAR